MSPLFILGGKKLSLQYCLKLSCNYNNPAYPTVFNFKLHSVFERKPTQLLPLAIRVSGDLQAVGFKKSDVITSSIPTIYEINTLLLLPLKIYLIILKH